MICGIGTDIAKVSRFEKWIKTPDMINKFFNEKEIKSNGSENHLCQHYAARFAAKEAFSKALGTGIVGFSIKDVYIQNDEKGKPLLIIENKAKEILEKLYGQCKIHITLSHEKEYAVAFVIIENNL